MRVADGEGKPVAESMIHAEMDPPVEEGEIAALAEEVNAGRIVLDEDEHWDRVDLLKGALGSRCANAVGSREDDQEEALALAESWVSTSYSQFEPRTSLLLAFWLEGIDAVCGRLSRVVEA